MDQLQHAHADLMLPVAATAAPTMDGVARLTYDAREVAAAIGISYSTMQKQCAARAWMYDRLPTPVRVTGKRLWRIATVERWLADLEAEQAA